MCGAGRAAELYRNLDSLSTVSSVCLYASKQRSRWFEGFRVEERRGAQSRAEQIEAHDNFRSKVGHKINDHTGSICLALMRELDPQPPRCGGERLTVLQYLLDCATQLSRGSKINPCTAQLARLPNPRPCTSVEDVDEKPRLES